AARQRPQRVEPHDLEADGGGGEALAHHRVGGAAVAARRGGDLVQLVTEGELLAERRGAALEGQRAHGDLPAFADAAHHVARRGAGAVEEHLVELAVAGELDDRPDLDAVLAHGHQQERDAGVPAARVGGGLGAGQHEAPVGPVGERGPHLLALDDPIVAVAPGPRGDVGEVAAGGGFGGALAPQRLAGHDRRQGAALLLGCPEGDERGAEQALADDAEAPGTSRPGVLLVVDHLLAQRQAAAAVLGGPTHAGPAVGRQVALPGEPLVEQRALVAGTATPPHDREVAGQAVLEERPDLVAEGSVLGALPQVHPR